MFTQVWAYRRIQNGHNKLITTNNFEILPDVLFYDFLLQAKIKVKMNHVEFH